MTATFACLVWRGLGVLAIGLHDKRHSDHLWIASVGINRIEPASLNSKRHTGCRAGLVVAAIEAWTGHGFAFALSRCLRRAHSSKAI